VTQIYETLYAIQRGVKAGNLDENWKGDTPQERARFDKLVEKFGDIYENEDWGA